MLENWEKLTKNKNRNTLLVSTNSMVPLAVWQRKRNEVFAMREGMVCFQLFPFFELSKEACKVSAHEWTRRTKTSLSFSISIAICSRSWNPCDVYFARAQNDDLNENRRPKNRLRNGSEPVDETERLVLEGSDGQALEPHLFCFVQSSHRCTAQSRHNNSHYSVKVSQLQTQLKIQKTTQCQKTSGRVRKVKR